MNIAEILGRNVMDLSTATTIGRVDDIIIDPATRRVTAFRVGKTKNPNVWLPFASLTALGADALTIADDTQLVEQPADAGPGIADTKVIGGRVLTEQGREIGPLNGIDIDDDGNVTALATATNTIAAGDLIGIGTYAVVVADHDTAQ